VLRQSGVDLEIIVVDDCSPDGSMEVIRTFEDSRIRIFRHDRNRGLAAARNTGIEAAAGKYIAFLDSDDIAADGRLRVQSQFLETKPAVVMCGGAVECLDSEGNATGRRWHQELSHERLRALLLFANRFFVSTLMIRAEVAKQLLFRVDFAMAEDYEFNVRASDFGEVANLRSTLTHYRLNPNGLSATKKDLMDEYVLKIMQLQLARLGVATEAHELKTHFHLYALRVTPSVGELDKVEQWLQKLISANRESKIYDEAVMRSVCSAYWFEACTHASPNGFEVVQRYWRAELRDASGTSSGRMLKMLAKAALRRGAAARRGNFRAQ